MDHSLNDDSCDCDQENITHDAAYSAVWKVTFAASSQFKRASASKWSQTGV